MILNATNQASRLKFFPQFLLMSGILIRYKRKSYYEDGNDGHYFKEHVASYYVLKPNVLQKVAQ